MDISTKVGIAEQAIALIDAGTPATEGFVTLAHGWADDLRPCGHTALADRLAAL